MSGGAAVWFENGEVRVDDAVVAGAIAEAYAEAVRDGHDMRRFVDLMEDTRERVARKHDPFALRQSLNHAAAGVEEVATAGLLAGAFRGVQAAVEEAFVAALDDWQGEERREGWLLLLSAALLHWELPLVRRLLGVADPVAPEDRELVAELERWLPALEQRRYATYGPVFDRLRRVDVLPPRHRAYHQALFALVVVYYENRLRVSRQLIAEAREMADELQAEISLCQYYEMIGHHHRARQLATGLLERWPASAEIYRVLARVARSEEDPRGAESWYQVAQRRAIDGEPTLIDHATLLVAGDREKRADEIRRLFERDVLLWPRNEALECCEMAQAYLDAGDPATAEAWVRRGLERQPDLPNLHLLLGRVHLAGEKVEEAEAAFAAAMEHNELAVSDLACDVGDSWSTAGRPERAVPWMELAVEQAGSCPQLLPVSRARRAAVRLEHAQDEASVEAARDELRGLLAAENDLWAALWPLLADARKRPFDEGWRAMEGLLGVVDPWMAQFVHNDLGHLAYNAGRLEAAAAAYRKAIEIEPEDPVLYRNLSSTLAQLGELEAAEREVTRAFELDGSERERDKAYARVQNLYGHRLFRDAAYEASADYYRRAAATDPSDAVLHANLGSAMVETAQIADTPTGRRVQVLEEAAAAYTNAVRAGGERYTGSRDEARAMLRQVQTYGGSLLSWSPAASQALQLQLSPGLADRVADAAGQLLGEVQVCLEELRGWFRGAYGIVLPGVNFRRVEDLDEGRWIGGLLGEPLVHGEVDLDLRVVAGPGERLAAAGFSGPADVHPLTGEAIQWAEAAEASEAERAEGELVVWPVFAYPLYRLVARVTHHLDALFGYEEMSTLLREAGLAAGRFADPAARTLLTRVADALLAEGCGIGPLDALCELVAAGLDGGETVSTMVERARSLPTIRPQLRGLHPATRLLWLDEPTLRLLEDGVEGAGEEPVLETEPFFAQSLIAEVQRHAADDGAPAALVVDRPLVRPHLHRLLALAQAPLPVLAADEVDDADEREVTRFGVEV